MKIAIHEELDISEALAAWLIVVRDQHYLVPNEIPQEARDLDLVDGSFPDFMLSEAGRKVARRIHARARSLVTQLAAKGIKSTHHGLGVLLSEDAVLALLARLPD